MMPYNIEYKWESINQVITKTITDEEYAELLGFEQQNRIKIIKVEEVQ